MFTVEKSIVRGDRKLVEVAWKNKKHMKWSISLLENTLVKLFPEDSGCHSTEGTSLASSFYPALQAKTLHNLEPVPSSTIIKHHLTVQPVGSKASRGRNWFAEPGTTCSRSLGKVWQAWLPRKTAVSSP